MATCIIAVSSVPESCPRPSYIGSVVSTIDVLLQVSGSMACLPLAYVKVLPLLTVSTSISNQKFERPVIHTGPALRLPF